ncbi:MAG: PilZ domain-containing protein [Terriglobales bacterium]
MSLNRRQFERLRLSEDAIALDQTGKKLGKVSSAGGGGFLIYPASPDATGLLAPGKRLTITVHEPKQNVNSTVDVEVRYREGAAVGVEFVGGEAVKK